MAPARQRVEQVIPIHNATDDPMVLRSTLTGKYFSGPPEVTIPPKGEGAYSLSFEPSWIARVEGKLELANQRTGELMKYTLTGVGVEPLAESKLQIQCKARSTVTRDVKVTNYGPTPVLYTIESDLPNISGLPTVQVGARQTVTYSF